jgi:hypothetical protein
LTFKALSCTVPFYFAQPLENTMNRCQKVAFTLATAALAGLLWTSAGAQTAVRSFPKGVQRGTLVVTAPPQVLLNGKAEQLSPGARIRSSNNMLAMSGTLVGLELPVFFLRDTQGQLHEVWILNAEEERASRPSLFNFSSWGWGSSAPPQDDGKTPYHQLPSFPKQ